MAIRRKLEKSDLFKNRYRMRSGIEATNSEYDRLTGIKHLRVRGFKVVRFCATIKALGINLGIDKKQIINLTTCNFMKEMVSVLIVGPCGTVG